MFEFLDDDGVLLIDNEDFVKEENDFDEDEEYDINGYDIFM